MRILVVDDDASVRRLLSVQLGLAGHEVHIADHGRAGLDAVHALQPDLVVLDVMMPELDGWQVLEQIRAEERYRDLPVIMLTAKDRREDAEHGYDIGASHFMGKPYDGERLLTMIEALGAQVEMLGASGAA
jgi:two-component system OmpR family response regulator